MVDFFPILHSWKQFQFLGVLKKDKGVREKKGNENLDFTIPSVCNCISH